MKMKQKPNLDKKLIPNFWLSLGLVLMFSVFLVQSVGAYHGAHFYLSPVLENYSAGQTFTLDLMINAEEGFINAVQATIHFSSDELKVIEISITGSVFSLWVQEPTWSNLEGEISFVGGLPSPGFTGEEKAFTITFRAKAQGQTEIYFSNERILADEPGGRDVFEPSHQISYSTNIVPGIEISIDNEGDPTNPRPLLYLGTKGYVLGIKYYEIEIGEEVFKLDKVDDLTWQIPALAPGDYSILVKAIDEAGNVIEDETEVVVESISVPEINFFPETFKSGEDIFYVGGTAIPNSLVLIYLKEGNELIKEWEVGTDEEGNWFLKEVGLFAKSGIYRVSAKAKDSRGAISNSSGDYLLKVVFGGIVLGPLLLTYKSLAFVAIVLLIALSGWLFYSFFRIMRMRESIVRETRDLKNKFYKEYEELREDIEREIKLLRTKGIGKEEKDLEKKLLKNLADIEKVLKEELKDIERIK
ncbi:MAG: hypothetical protein KJI71_03715 [Patescibacteria group bacterium]|nr:hypothetical protein [Patescibacteria group bacterium]